MTGIRGLLLLTVFSSTWLAWAAGAPLLLNTNRLHLGTRGSPEWESFSGQTPDAQRLDRRFTAARNEREATLFIRQDDVKLEWTVTLNDQALGKLFLMEADLFHALRIPPGALRDGENVLSIVPPKAIDDILLHEIRLDPRPFTEAVTDSTLVVEVTAVGDKKAVPCRLTIVDQRGTLTPLMAITNATSSSDARTPRIAIRPGVVYTGDGRARVGLPAGDYTIYASRGFEWSVATQRVQIAVGGSHRAALELRHEVPTPGWVSCDTHVHTFTHSRHGDATLEERMLTLAGEGIEMPVATDHNLQADYSEPARRMGVADRFTPITGNEVTTPTGHFNIFPVELEARVPDFRIQDWPALMNSLRATPGVRVVVLNHPRNVHTGFQPFAATNYNRITGENKRGPEFTFDAIELMNSSAQQNDYLLVYHDWFALLNYGYRITGVGSSDCHDVSRYIVGQGRTYIRAVDVNPAAIDVAAACSNLLSGHALVSMGLLTEMTVAGKFTAGELAKGLGDQVPVTVKVLGPSWVTATNVTLFANGIQVWETEIKQPAARSNSPRNRGEKGQVTWTIPRPKHDVYLVAIATGPGVTAPFWAIPKPYQPTSPHWESRVIGSTNPIWLDADGNGEFTPARAYAHRLVTHYADDPVNLLPALGGFDEAVSAQAAGLCSAAGVALERRDFELALGKAQPHVRRGFAAWAATQK